MRLVGLSGVVILLVSVIISGATYLGVRGFVWTPGDMGFIYSFVITVGFLVSIGAGLFGAVKESEEFLIAAGTACIVLALLNKLFSSVLYSWSYLDITLLLAGVAMILDRFHVKRVKMARKLEEPKPEQLLESLDRLEAEVSEARPAVVPSREKELSEVKRRLWLEVQKKPELIKTLRARLYYDRTVQEILKRFLNSDLKAIEPDVKTSTKPSYPQLLELEKDSRRNIQSILNDLVDTSTLLRDLYEKLVACPYCHQSSRIFLRIKCPKCDSRKTAMNRLMEHTDCGAIFKYEEYLGPDGFRCLKCGKAFAEESGLKSVGVTFECQSCRSVFNDPKRSYYCRNCAAEFQFESSESEEIYSYALNDGVRAEAKEMLSVLTIANMIESLGYKASVPGFLKGRTGVSHEFTLTCSRDERLFAIDFVITDKENIGTKMILSSYAKFSDVKATRCLLVAVPELEQQARDFLDANKILYIEGEDPSEIGDKVKQILERST